MPKLSKKPNHQELIQIQAGKVSLHGYLTIPAQATKIVLFAHGSGSGRNSRRNQYVASVLQEGGLATLLMDLLTEEEEAVDEITREHRFNIPLLAQRLADATDFLKLYDDTKSLAVAYFGASTGAAAALIAAAEKGSLIKSVVSRGGRPDLAAPILHKVVSPTLLIVGGDDFGVIELNQEAFEMISAEKRLEIVPHATHLFEEPGTLEEVARLARQWIVRH